MNKRKKERKKGGRKKERRKTAQAPHNNETRYCYLESGFDADGEPGQKGAGVLGDGVRIVIPGFLRDVEDGRDPRGNPSRQLRV